VLALSAPATYWIGLGRADLRGWLLWVLCWTFSTMSIVHVYARLAQRRPGDADLQSLRRPARKALAVNSLLLVLVAITTSLANGSPLVPAAFLPQWVESARASFARVPAPRPATIGVRQFAVSAIFTALFILFWQ
jgi:hypothetical protein